MSGGEKEKCPACGRLIYSDRPSCLYCGWERRMDESQRAELRKKLVLKGLGVEESEAGAAAGKPSIPVKSAAKCGKCGAPLKPGMRFCTGCGTPAPAGEPATAVPVARSSPTPEPKIKPSIADFKPIAAMSERIVVAGEGGSEIMKTVRENVLWAVGAGVLLFARMQPFGVLPEKAKAFAPRPAWPVDFPNELVVGFFLIAACALLYVPAVKRVADAKRLTVGFAAAWCLYALFIINGVFVNKSRVVELVVIIIPVVFLFGRAVFKKDVPFVAAAVLYSSVIVSEAVFLLKLELLSGTGWSLLGNMGFIFSVIGLFLIFSWAFMKMNFKWKRKRAPEVAAEERSEE